MTPEPCKQFTIFDRKNILIAFLSDPDSFHGIHAKTEELEVSQNTKNEIDNVFTEF